MIHSSLSLHGSSTCETVTSAGLRQRREVPPLAFAFAFAFTIALSSLRCCDGLLLDIHVPLRNAGDSLDDECCPYAQALLWNLRLRQWSKDDNDRLHNADNERGDGVEHGAASSTYEAIDFFSRHTPHVTLFLADFDVEENEPRSEQKSGGQKKMEKDTDGPRAETYFLETSRASPSSAQKEPAAPKDAKKSSSSSSSVRPVVHEDGHDDHRPYDGLNATKVDALVRAVRSAVAAHRDGPCDVEINSYDDSGAYVMLRVETTPCLRRLSDAVVRATVGFVRRSSSSSTASAVPRWVLDLPPSPTRDRKIAYARGYGSPNVFDEFDPHVTVAYYETTAVDAENVGKVGATTSRTDAIDQIPPNCSQPGYFVSVGRTDVGGSVLQRSLSDVKVPRGDATKKQESDSKSDPSKAATAPSKNEKAPSEKTASKEITPAKAATATTSKKEKPPTKKVPSSKAAAAAAVASSKKKKTTTPKTSSSKTNPSDNASSSSSEKTKASSNVSPPTKKKTTPAKQSSPPNDERIVAEAIE